GSAQGSADDEFAVVNQLSIEILRALLADDAEFRSTDLNEVVRETGTLVQRLFPSSVDLRVNLCSSPLTIWGDRSQIEQALINLAINAVDALPDGGEVELRTTFQPSSAMVEVSDTGCGIPQEILEHVFEPFFTTKGSSGTGLGLSVVKGVVDAHDGSIDISSEVSTGTTFRLTFPLTDREALPDEGEIVGSDEQSSRQSPAEEADAVQRITDSDPRE
ncbi:MAG: ATP-binding protein, partial [Thermoanaerobaculia bacterium]|nr:ATP-binding protein [Thermoanaerobaculia bacterium]